MNQQFVITAIVTPFATNGEVDHGAIEEQVVFLSREGISSIVCCGTTGEFSSLTIEERQSVLETCRASFSGRVIAHVGHSCVKDSKCLVAHANGFADAVLLPSPYYFANPEPTGVSKFFSEVLAECQVPAYLYNFPKHTQFTIPASMLSELKQTYPALCGMKDSGKDRALSRAYLKTFANVEVYLGDDFAVLTACRGGFNGIVTGGGLPFSGCAVRAMRAAVVGDKAIAEREYNYFEEWTRFRKGFVFSDIAIVKAALTVLIEGFPVHVRPPLVESDSVVVAVREYVCVLCAQVAAVRESHASHHPQS